MSLESLLQNTPTGDFPKKVDPMLAAPHKEPFNEEGWIHEIKWDGHRMVAKVQGETKRKTVKLVSRKGITQTKYGPIQEALAGLPYDVVLDGEIVVLNNKGIARLSQLQKYDPRDRIQREHLRYQVFDVLHVDGHDVTSVTLETRKQILKEILDKLNTDNVRYNNHVDGMQGVEFHTLIRQQGIEGIVSKHLKSTYKSGQRTKDWRKIKYPGWQKASKAE